MRPGRLHTTDNRATQPVNCSVSNSATVSIELPVTEDLQSPQGQRLHEIREADTLRLPAPTAKNRKACVGVWHMQTQTVTCRRDRTERTISPIGRPDSLATYARYKDSRYYSDRFQADSARWPEIPCLRDVLHADLSARRERRPSTLV